MFFLMYVFHNSVSNQKKKIIIGFENKDDNINLKPLKIEFALE